MKPANQTPEKQIETYLRKRVQDIGGRCIKMVPTYENGIPDRQVLYKGRTIFVELKKQGKDPSKLQAVFIKELEKNGFETRVIDGKDQVDELINNLLNA